MEKIVCKADGVTCNQYSELPDGRWMCKGDIRSIPLECLIRKMTMLLATMAAPSPLKKKVEKMIDDVDKGMNEGEQWKK